MTIRCAALHKGRLFAVTQDRPGRLIWSAIGDPTRWREQDWIELPGNVRSLRSDSLLEIDLDTGQYVLSGAHPETFRLQPLREAVLVRPVL